MRRPGKAVGTVASALPLLIAAAALALALFYPILRRLPDTLFWAGNGLGAAALLGFLLIDPAAWWSSLLGLIGVALGALGSVGVAERHHCPAGPHWLDIKRKPARGGAELVSYDCPVCGYRRIDRVALAAGNGEWFSGPSWTAGGGWGSGGGFEGFSGGGGDFGGGGASGSW